MEDRGPTIYLGITYGGKVLCCHDSCSFGSIFALDIPPEKFLGRKLKTSFNIKNGEVIFGIEVANLREIVNEESRAALDAMPPVYALAQKTWEEVKDQQIIFHGVDYDGNIWGKIRFSSEMFCLKDLPIGPFLNRDLRSCFHFEGNDKAVWNGNGKSYGESSFPLNVLGGVDYKDAEPIEGDEIELLGQDYYGFYGWSYKQNKYVEFDELIGDRAYFVGKTANIFSQPIKILEQRIGKNNSLCDAVRNKVTFPRPGSPVPDYDFSKVADDSIAFKSIQPICLVEDHGLGYHPATGFLQLTREQYGLASDPTNKELKYISGVQGDTIREQFMKSLANHLVIPTTPTEIWNWLKERDFQLSAVEDSGLFKEYQIQRVNGGLDFKTSTKWWRFLNKNKLCIYSYNQKGMTDCQTGPAVLDGDEQYWYLNGKLLTALEIDKLVPLDFDNIPNSAYSSSSPSLIRKEKERNLVWNNRLNRLEWNQEPTEIHPEAEELEKKYLRHKFSNIKDLIGIRNYGNIFQLIGYNLETGQTYFYNLTTQTITQNNLGFQKTWENLLQLKVGDVFKIAPHLDYWSFSDAAEVSRLDSTELAILREKYKLLELQDTFDLGKIKPDIRMAVKNTIPVVPSTPTEIWNWLKERGFAPTQEELKIFKGKMSRGEFFRPIYEYNFDQDSEHYLWRFFPAEKLSYSLFKDGYYYSDFGPAFVESEREFYYLGRKNVTKEEYFSQISNVPSKEFKLIDFGMVHLKGIYQLVGYNLLDGSFYLYDLEKKDYIKGHAKLESSWSPLLHIKIGDLVETKEVGDWVVPDQRSRGAADSKLGGEALQRIREKLTLKEELSVSDTTYGGIAEAWKKHMASLEKYTSVMIVTQMPEDYHGDQFQLISYDSGSHRAYLYNYRTDSVFSCVFLQDKNINKLAASLPFGQTFKLDAESVIIENDAPKKFSHFELTQLYQNITERTKSIFQEKDGRVYFKTGEKEYSVPGKIVSRNPPKLVEKITLEDGGFLESKGGNQIRRDCGDCSVWYDSEKIDWYVNGKEKILGSRIQSTGEHIGVFYIDGKDCFTFPLPADPVVKLTGSEFIITHANGKIVGNLNSERISVTTDNLEQVYYKNGDYEYFLNNELHRLDGPAKKDRGIEYWYCEGKNIIEVIDGKIIRINGSSDIPEEIADTLPTVISDYIPETSTTKFSAFVKFNNGYEMRLNDPSHTTATQKVIREKDGRILFEVEGVSYSIPGKIKERVGDDVILEDETILGVYKNNGKPVEISHSCKKYSKLYNQNGIEWFRCGNKFLVSNYQDGKEIGSFKLKDSTKTLELPSVYEVEKDNFELKINATTQEIIYNLKGEYVTHRKRSGLYDITFYPNNISKDRYFRQSGILEREVYKKDGKIHNLEGPANLFYSCGNKYEEWWLDSKYLAEILNGKLTYLRNTAIPAELKDTIPEKVLEHSNEKVVFKFANGYIARFAIAQNKWDLFCSSESVYKAMEQGNISTLDLEQKMEPPLGAQILRPSPNVEEWTWNGQTLITVRDGKTDIPLDWDNKAAIKSLRSSLPAHLSQDPHTDLVVITFANGDCLEYEPTDLTLSCYVPYRGTAAKELPPLELSETYPIDLAEEGISAGYRVAANQTIKLFSNWLRNKLSEELDRSKLNALMEFLSTDLGKGLVGYGLGLGLHQMENQRLQRLGDELRYEALAEVGNGVVDQFMSFLTQEREHLRLEEGEVEELDEEIMEQEEMVGLL